MNIIILAAGRGTRLGNHNNKPKCLFNIDGLSLIERNLVLFKEAGLHPILVTGYQKDKLGLDIFIFFVSTKFHRATEVVSTTLFQPRKAQCPGY